MTLKKRLIRTFILSLVGLAIGAFIAWIQIQDQQSSGDIDISSAPVSQAVKGIALDGRFELVNDQGVTVTQADYDGQYKLIYFGFTYCPAICPTELQKISQVMNALDERKAQKIQPLFITVDPERDTVEVMHDYVGMFHPDLVGLTGTPAQIDRVKQGFKVFSTEVQSEDATDYSVDHSSFIYFMNPDNQVISIYRIQDDVDMITADIVRHLTQS